MGIHDTINKRAGSEELRTRRDKRLNELYKDIATHGVDLLIQSDDFEQMIPNQINMRHWAVCAMEDYPLNRDNVIDIFDKFLEECDGKVTLTENGMTFKQFRQEMIGQKFVFRGILEAMPEAFKFGESEIKQRITEKFQQDLDKTIGEVIVHPWGLKTEEDEDRDWEN